MWKMAVPCSKMYYTLLGRVFFLEKFQKSLHFPLSHHLAKKRGTFENVKVSLKAFTKYSKVVYAVTFIS